MWWWTFSHQTIEYFNESMKMGNEKYIYVLFIMHNSNFTFTSPWKISSFKNSLRNEISEPFALAESCKSSRLHWTCVTAAAIKKTGWQHCFIFDNLSVLLQPDLPVLKGLVVIWPTYIYMPTIILIYKMNCHWARTQDPLTSLAESLSLSPLTCRCCRNKKEGQTGNRMRDNDCMATLLAPQILGY